MAAGTFWKSQDRGRPNAKAPQSNLKEGFQLCVPFTRNSSAFKEETHILKVMILEAI